ncbi:hypothetical protein [Moheibacter sediminis]|uniref:Lipoprotein n=1 Tax=Moheibacter sediminis TaxID=1434700 RepID=A0A1W2BQ94_9FLAO|nr:hypothetical protein [Moheibacter sediminis]SMC75100.1 hypothetical protein SAMN06296427_10743 [Moheibacter sediminis]
MKIRTLLLISILLVSCNRTFEIGISEEKTGIGLIYLDINSPIYLYSDKTSKIPFDSIVFKNNKIKTSILKQQLQPYKIYQGDTEKEAKINEQKGLIEFKPQIIFRVLEKDKNFWQVIINEKESEFVYLNLEKYQDLSISNYLKEINFDPNFVPDEIKNWYLFEDWMTTFRSSFIPNSDNLIFHNQPDGNKINTKLEFINYQIDTIQNDWMKVKLNDSISGWIRWKRNDSIVLKYNRFLYY